VQHSVGTIIWGQGASADMLFASSEAQGIDDYTGYHIAFDADQGRCIYNFSAKESGDAMALDPDGTHFPAQLSNRSSKIDCPCFPQVCGWPCARLLVTPHISCAFTTSAERMGNGPCRRSPWTRSMSARAPHSLNHAKAK
jgi:hypothetical protein